jgi:SpoVK/Ycf46/Vps4 family AAA+-type ATPase
VMVLAATNRPWELDEAILRRLPRAFEVGMPDKQQRASILKVILKDEDCAPCLDIEQLAILTEGYSGSDLTELCKQAAYLPIRDLLDEERVHAGGHAEAKVCQRFLFACGRNLQLCVFSSA